MPDNPPAKSLDELPRADIAFKYALSAYTAVLGRHQNFDASAMEGSTIEERLEEMVDKENTARLALVNAHRSALQEAIERELDACATIIEDEARRRDEDKTRYVPLGRLAGFIRARSTTPLPEGE